MLPTHSSQTFIATLLVTTFFIILGQKAWGHPAENSQLSLDINSGKVDVELLIPVDQLQWVAPGIFPHKRISSTLTEAAAVYSKFDDALASAYILQHITLTSAGKNSVAMETINWQPQVTNLLVTKNDHGLMLKADLTFLPGYDLNDQAGDITLQSDLSLTYDGIVHQIRNHRIFVSRPAQGSHTDTAHWAENIGVLRYNNTTLVVEAPLNRVQ